MQGFLLVYYFYLYSVYETPAQRMVSTCTTRYCIAFRWNVSWIFSINNRKRMKQQQKQDPFLKVEDSTTNLEIIAGVLFLLLLTTLLIYV